MAETPSQISLTLKTTKEGTRTPDEKQPSSPQKKSKKKKEKENISACIMRQTVACRVRLTALIVKQHGDEALRR